MSRSPRSPKGKSKEQPKGTETSAPEKAPESAKAVSDKAPRKAPAKAKAAPDAAKPAPPVKEVQAAAEPAAPVAPVPEKKINIQYPQTIEEAGTIVAKAAGDLMSVVPAGHLTRLHDSPAVSRAVAVVLSTRDLTRVVSVEPDNLLAIVEAGLTPDEVDEALKPTGLYWPVTGLGQRTLGAIMAEGALGVETMARGSMLDWVLGSSFITAEGKLVESGGRTLKNVTGYDYTRLAWRSFGRLGLCVRFILKLIPRPAMNPVLEVAVDKPADGAALAREIILSKMGPEALRLDYSPNGAALLVWLAGFPEVVAAKKAKVEEMAGSRTITVHDDGRAFWSERSKKWPASTPAISGFMGSRQAVLDMAGKLGGGTIAGVLKADIDVGGGRAYLELEESVSSEGTAKTVGLTPDRFTATGLVYERLKKGIDPGDLFFPAKLL
ncbi:hypothetical protein C4J81_05450 [Deltaproteobacteria bacterium Smac51]|nr:hypothetical protein C4J81_05450 [Deltaproteobacteria bacterium Smac51]